MDKSLVEFLDGIALKSCMLKQDYPKDGSEKMRTYTYCEDVFDHDSKNLVHEEIKYEDVEELFEMTRAKWRKIASADRSIFSLCLIEREGGHDLELKEEFGSVVVIRRLCVEDE